MGTEVAEVCMKADAGYRLPPYQRLDTTKTTWQLTEEKERISVLTWLMREHGEQVGREDQVMGMTGDRVTRAGGRCCMWQSCDLEGIMMGR